MHKRLGLFFCCTITKSLVPAADGKVGERVAIVAVTDLVVVGLGRGHNTIHHAVFLETLPVLAVEQLLVERRLPVPVIKVIGVRPRHHGHRQSGGHFLIVVSQLIVAQLNVIGAVSPVNEVETTTTRRVERVAKRGPDVLLRILAIHEVVVLRRHGSEVTKVVKSVGAGGEQIVGVGIAGRHVVVEAPHYLLVANFDVLAIRLLGILVVGLARLLALKQVAVTVLARLLVALEEVLTPVLVVLQIEALPRNVVVAATAHVARGALGMLVGVFHLLTVPVGTLTSICVAIVDMLLVVCH
mmetsp:Transcript_4307/g.6337  ORF Transcript_4307/g.6337 Transcript_4307/m.6337 type:complete len:298 (-) Transcript_4307:1448-2341(-)